MKHFKPILISLVILFLLICLEVFTFRRSLLFVIVISLFALPISYCKKWAFNRLAVIIAALALILALSPIDFAIHNSGKFALDMLPVSFGNAATPGTYSYGCIIPRYPPRYAIVLSY